MIKRKKLPVGISDFQRLITDHYYFVDKSFLIKEVLDSGAAVTLIPRPRRFGKTLNLSLLRYFFEKTAESNRALFDGLKIANDQECMAEQGQYPVIFLTLKDVKEITWDTCYGKLKQLIADEFKRHSYLQETLSMIEKQDFETVVNRTACQALFENALKNLSAYLYHYHGKRAIILIDEYDSPIQAGFLNNYYNDIINFMRGFLCAGLKDNSSVKFGILTGILRIAKESIFSGMNNLEVCTMVNEGYADKFGLLEDEVKEILSAYGLESKIEDVRAWYNGYSSGKYTVYNPWSIINLVKQKGALQPYWVNTSDNALVKELIKYNTQGAIKKTLETLLAAGGIEKKVIENIVFKEIYSNSDIIWNFLLFTGYLTFKKYHMMHDEWYAELVIPNKEVMSLWKNVISDWFTSLDQSGYQRYLDMLNGIKTGNVKMFTKKFYDVMANSASYFDVTGEEPERVYHALVLGMLVGLVGEYEVKSNRESGFGRYDVMLIPLKPNLRGYIFEFKTVDDNETLESAVDDALKQIEEKKYEQELRARGVTNIVKLAIAFEGKKALVKEGKVC